MQDTNIINMIGRLTKDPESYNPGNGVLVTDFVLACNNKYKSKDKDVDETIFIKVTAFGKLTSVIKDWAYKGQKVFVAGRLKIDKYKDKDGYEQQRNNIILRDIQFLEYKEDKEKTRG